jgi:uroporphyrinogen decarboxylase
VHFVELFVDREVIEYITKNEMDKELFYLEAEEIRRQKLTAFKENHQSIVLLTEEKERAYYQQYIDFYYQMGYDYFPDVRPFSYLKSMIMSKVRLAKDTALLPRKGGYYGAIEKQGSREWAEEGTGVISSWKDLEKFPWNRIKLDLDNHYDFLTKYVPEGMKAIVTGSLYEPILERLLGYEGLFYLLHDDPQLVKEVTDRWGKVVSEFYQNVVGREVVGGIFHGDDLGYKTGTMVSPDILRETFLPWFKKYALLAHEQDKMFWLHSCGNVLEVMEDLIEDVGIDAFHSFQDVIIPVAEFKKRYQNRIATLGGVDVDKLARLDESNLRKYTRRILDECMSGGRYALGSANSITNYIPIKNYFAMLEEGLKWGKS